MCSPVSRGNVMHSAFFFSPCLFPVECSAKVQLIQSLVDDSHHHHHQCPILHRCTDTHTHTHPNTFTTVPGWMRFMRSVLRQPLSALVKWSPVPQLHYKLSLLDVFYQPMQRHAPSFAVFSSVFPLWGVSLTQTRHLPCHEYIAEGYR